MPESIRYDADPVRHSSLLSLSYALSHSAEAVKLHILTLSISGLTCPTICCLSSVVKYNKLCTRRSGVGVKTFLLDKRLHVDQMGLLVNRLL